MKFVTFSCDGRAVPGVVIGPPEKPRILNLDAAARRVGEPAYPSASLLDLIEAGDRALDATRRVVEWTAADEDLSLKIGSVVLLPPVPVPPQMRDFSVFPGHIRNAPAGMQRIAARRHGDEAAAAAVKALEDVPQVYRDRPIYYITNRFSVSGPGADIVWPDYSDLMDFELEFGIFLSRGGRDIRAADASSHIFGYTIYNDFSARDSQFEEMQGMLGPAKGKSFDAGNVLGPWIVTRDEIPDPYSLTMRATVNGEVWTDSNSTGMLHSFEEMIAYVSRGETLRPGEFFGSGTVGGGCGLEIDRWLKHGDVVELEVERIGVLRNRVLRAEGR
ncbi:2-keto-4-pentenoate hydratase/2-oxohepta-3-ene-1,7-dioic acid hydratase in catechol pathway [Bradyrhizobium diazoefficiens]|uniref:fumarylacetoacetate hydrolase family protein n=1 Tax=Bradyrhizobium diazoefficiens TaxID=1355477 RepID=UPI003511D44B